jgi:hypothetical protein
VLVVVICNCLSPIKKEDLLKTFSFTIGLFFGVLVLSPTESQAQWQPDVRLTNDPATSYTSYNNAWCIAASGDDVHIVWYDYRYGASEICYKRSTDGGDSWGEDTRLTNDPAYSWRPSVSVFNSVVHVIWEDLRDGAYSEIYYKRSTDGGVSWEADTRLTNNSANSTNSSISVSGQIVQVVWQDQRDGNYEIYHKRSSDGGVTWGVDTRLTNNSATSAYPSVSISGQVVHVVWQDLRDGNLEIYYKRSTDGGVSWEADTRLTNIPAVSESPSVSVSGQVVHVVWHDNNNGGNYEIYYKRSTDGGATWEADTRLTNAPGGSYNPSVCMFGSNVHVVWYDYRISSGNAEIYHKRSTDGGVSWEADTQLTNAPNSSWNASVAVSGQIVHVVWQDGRDGNYEIYYKRNPTGNPTGVDITNSGIPGEFQLHQSYPNPFNPATTFSYQLPILSNVTLKVYDVLGREVATLVDDVEAPGYKSVNFNASALASGVYFYRLEAGSFAETKKLILLR